MALKKTFELQNGAEGDYIRIARVEFVNGQNECLVQVQYWRNEAIRNTDMRCPMEIQNLQVELQGSGDILQRAYNGLKALADYAGAEDV